jgi:hypothetical protein
MPGFFGGCRQLRRSPTSFQDQKQPSEGKNPGSFKSRISRKDSEPERRVAGEIRPPDAAMGIRTPVASVRAHIQLFLPPKYIGQTVIAAFKVLSGTATDSADGSTNSG